MSPRTGVITVREFVLAGLCVGVVAASMAALTTHARAADDSDRAAGYLAKVAAAEGKSYTCKQLVTFFGSPQSAALLDVRSSPRGRFVESASGTSITRVWDDAPATVPMQPTEVLDKYSVTVGTPRKMLGVDVVPLALTRRSDGVLVERWLVHPTSGMVYRRESFDADGRLVGLSTVTDMDWGATSEPEPMLRNADSATRVRMVSDAGAPKRLDNGYRLLRSYELQAGGRPADHWVYTDGLHALSVFRTEGGFSSPAGFVAADLGATRGWTGPGPGTWAWEGDGASWILVAEEPGLDGAALTAPFPRGGRSLWARAGSLWSRMFGAIAGLIG